MSDKQTLESHKPKSHGDRSYGYRLRDHLRIVLAIAAKDILEAIKNKNTITVMISSLFIVIMYWALPYLENGVERTTILIYDAGSSSVVPLLENQGAYRIRTYDSQAEMLRSLAAGDRLELGVSIPADFDQILEAGGTPHLQGFLMNWISEKQAQELTGGFEAELQSLFGRPIPLQTQGNIVYMRSDVRGAGVQAAMSTSFLLVMIGLTLVAHLMLEEKHTKTIQAVLVSPAGAGHIVAGKAIAGLFYCLLGAVVALAVNANLVVHWSYALLVILVGSLFTVSLGLWLGVIIENRAQLTLWAWILILPLFAPIMISLLDDLVPAGVVQVARLVPTAILLDQLQAAFSGSFPLGTGLLQLIWIIAWTGAVLLIVSWVVRQSDREAVKLPGLWQRLLQSTAPARPNITRASLQDLHASAPAAEWVSQPALPQPGRPARPVSGWGLIWTIAWKDIREAIQNKIVISVLLGVALVMLSSLALPLLLSLQDTPTAVIYDEGHSTIVAALSGRDELRLRGTDLLEAMGDVLTTLPTPMLGLVLPPNFDQLAGSAETIELEGDVAHWIKPEEANRLVTFFEEQLSRASWGTVEITISDQRMYPQMEQPLMLGFVQITSILSIGVALVPFLFVEEKESHTLEALLISPVDIRQVVAGKALAGLFFCLLAAAVLLAFNAYSITHWGVALLAALLTGAFAVSIGLLVGALSDNPTNVGMWGGLLLIVLIALLLASAFSPASWPQWLQTLLDWSPGKLISRLFSLALVGEVSIRLLWAPIAGLIAAITISMSIVFWRLARYNR